MPSGIVGASAVDVSKQESDRLEREAALLEQQLAQIRGLRELQGAGPPPAVPAATDAGAADAGDGRRWGARQRAVAEDEGGAGFRWRGAAGPLEGEEGEEGPSAPPRRQFEGSDEDDQALLAQLGFVFAPARAAAAASVPRKPVLKPGEWIDVESFLDNIGLGRFGYGPLFRDRGLDTPEAIERLDPVRLRKLGITDNRHALKLRMGIAELRTFAGAGRAGGGRQPLAGASAAAVATAAQPSSGGSGRSGCSGGSGAPRPPLASTTLAASAACRRPSAEAERAPTPGCAPGAIVRSASRRRTPPPPSAAALVAGAISRRRSASSSPAPPSHRLPPEDEERELAAQVARPPPSRRPAAPPPPRATGGPPPRPPLVRG